MNFGTHRLVSIIFKRQTGFEPVIIAWKAIVLLGQNRRFLARILCGWRRCWR